MRRDLLLRLHAYFAAIGNPSGDEKAFLEQLTAELSSFHITSVHRDDLLDAGFNPTGVTDEEMQLLASRLSDSYLEFGFGDALYITADQYLKVPRIDEKHYVLVEFPEHDPHFENKGIGYPCFNSEDNGARYVPIMEYVKRRMKYPAARLIFEPLRWPESQNYLDHPDKRCEVVMADEKALADFGSSAVWVPVEVLEGKESKYARVLDEVRSLFAAEIAEADANPDKWYEVFVGVENEGTHTEASGGTFDDAVSNFESIADEWGIDHTSIDIWGNRENPSVMLQIK
jgi:hypothetical protein